jgi:hypothetical protein
MVTGSPLPQNVKAGAIDLSAITEESITMESQTAPSPVLTLDVNSLSTVKAPAKPKAAKAAKAAPKGKAAPAKAAPAKAQAAKAPAKAQAAPVVTRGVKVSIPGVGQHCLAAHLEGDRVALPLGGIAWDYTQHAWLTGKDAKLRTLAKALSPFTPKGAGQAGPVAYLTLTLAQAQALADGLWQAAPVAQAWAGMANAQGVTLEAKAAQALLRKRLRQHARAVAGRIGHTLEGDTLTAPSAK